MIIFIYEVFVNIRVYIYFCVTYNYFTLPEFYTPPTHQSVSKYKILHSKGISRNLYPGGYITNSFFILSTALFVIGIP